MATSSSVLKPLPFLFLQVSPNHGIPDLEEDKRARPYTLPLEQETKLSHPGFHCLISFLFLSAPNLNTEFPER